MQKVSNEGKTPQKTEDLSERVVTSLNKDEVSNRTREQNFKKRVMAARMAAQELRRGSLELVWRTGDGNAHQNVGSAFTETE